MAKKGRLAWNDHVLTFIGVDSEITRANPWYNEIDVGLNIGHWSWRRNL